MMHNPGSWYPEKDVLFQKDKYESEEKEKSDTIGGLNLIVDIATLGESAALLDGLASKGLSALIGKQAFKAGGKETFTIGKNYSNFADDIADATGFGPKADAIRIHGPWTKNDLARATEGQGPVDFIPTVNKAGKQMPLELHHGDQMPGSAIHEVPPSHSKIVPHPNKFNQGVTPLMRQQDSKFHWYMRGLEMGNK